MAGKIPSFITGANCKIKLAGKTIAYGQDVSYNVTVTTIPIETIGRYEVVSNEPVAYFVDGTLSIIRYTSIANANSMNGTANGGNGVGKIGVGTGKNAADHFNPGNMLISETFDIFIYQKKQTAHTSDSDTAGAITTVTEASTTSQEVIALRDCRFIRKGSTVNKRGVLTEQFAFNAILHDDDSFNASYSGDQDLDIA